MQNMKITEPTAERRAVRQALLVHLAFKEAIAFSSDTFWEEVKCVGFNPELDQLVAVVSVKQTTGYQGGLCSAGSTEYVRFFVDWGSGLTNVGLTSFAVHDIPNTAPDPAHPISYMVRLTIDDATHRKLCKHPVLPHVRAVLSWNSIPALDPNQLPVFGNHADADIQLRKQFPFLSTFVSEGVLKIPEWALEQIDLEAPLQAQTLKVTPLEALLPRYREQDVPDHRTLYPALHPLVEGGVSAAGMAQVNFGELAKLKIDVAALVGTLAPSANLGTVAPQGNTEFEELTCAGLDTKSDTLAAVIKIKRHVGYGGTLCQAGSTEYVAFWADWGDTGSFGTYLGTAMVQVYDIKDIQSGGLSYAVVLPANFSAHLEPCGHPNLVRLRAVLSWGVPPSTVDPNALNFWGSRLDVAMQIRPGRATTGLTGLLFDIGSVPTPNISKTTYLAFPSAGALGIGGCSALADRPFAGKTSVSGSIFNGAPGTVYYSAQFVPHGSTVRPGTPVMHGAFAYTLSDPTTPPFFQRTVTYTSTDGWYLFEDNPAALQVNTTNLLAEWNTGAVPDGAYDLFLAYTTDYPITGTSNIVYTNPTAIVVSNRDFTVSQTASTKVDTRFDVDLVIDEGDCNKFEQSATIHGHLRAVNPYFWRWTLELQPTTHTQGTQPVPQCRGYGSLADQGATPSEAWTLDTSKLDKCGYTIKLIAYDRAILNSNTSSAHSASKAVGFAVI